MGGRFSANLFVKGDRTDFRFIGMEMAYSHEFGSYADFRQQVNNLPNYYVDTRTNLLTVGLTTEVIFHGFRNPNFEHGIRGFFGTTFGYSGLDDSFYNYQNSTQRTFRNFFPKASYFIKFKNYFGTVEAGSNFFIRFGYTF